MKQWLFIVLATLSLSAVADDEELDCNNIRNTPDTNRCAAIELEAAEDVLTHYLETSIEHNAFDPELVDAIKVAQKQWQAYAAAHCGAVYAVARRDHSRRNGHYVPYPVNETANARRLARFSDLYGQYAAGFTGTHYRVTP